jgi:hypothetical protein
MLKWSMRWVEHRGVRKIREAYRVSVAIPERGKPFGRLRIGWKIILIRIFKK